MSYAISQDELRVSVANYVHGTRNLDALSPDEMAGIDDAIRRGLRRVYYPESSGAQYHAWSFLVVPRQVVLEPSQYECSMDPDHGFFQSGLSFVSPQRFDTVTKVTDNEVRQRRNRATQTTGIPSVFAERLSVPTNSRPQTIVLSVWPTPSEKITLEGIAKILPMALGPGRDYPAGGPQHATTFELACLAEAEIANMGMPMGYYQQFLTALQGSIINDRSMNAPSTYGYNGRGRNSHPVTVSRVIGDVTVWQ